MSDRILNLAMITALLSGIGAGVVFLANLVHFLLGGV